MRLRRIGLLWTLILCLLAAARANGTEFGFAGEGDGPSSSASAAPRAVGNSAHLIEAATAGSSATEPSTELLLLIGLALIGGASLIGEKIGSCGSSDEGENTGQTAILSRPTWIPHEPRTPSITRISTNARKGTAAIAPAQIQQVRRAPAKYGR